MIIAFHCQTESNDRYMLLEEVIKPEDFMVIIKSKLGQELAYVYEWQFKSLPNDAAPEIESLFRILIKEAYEEYGE